MKTIIRGTLALLVCVSLAHAQVAGSPPVTLKVGDAAPALAGTQWLKGEPVKSFEKGKIYVVEFWATWCGPCIAAIPHVTEMQKTYEKDGVIFIGQNVWENDPKASEPFVKGMGDKMDYRVVMDDLSGGGKGKMAETWMGAAGQNGIPCSFLIDRTGKLAWIGHPMALEPVLKQVIAGTFDPVKAAAEQAAFEQFTKDLNGAASAKDWPKAMKLLDDYEPKVSPDSMVLSQLAMLRFNLLLENKQYEAAYKQGRMLLSKMKDDADALNDMAWRIAADPTLANRDLDLAEQAAARAVEITKGQDASVLDTHARVYFERGQVDKAIELQTKAVDQAVPQMKQDLTDTLKKYTDAKSKPR